MSRVFGHWGLGLLAAFALSASASIGHAQSTAPKAAAPAADAAKQPAPSTEAGAMKSLGQTCFCVISKDNLTAKTSATGVCQDLTAAVGLHWSSPTSPPIAHSARESACSSACSPKVSDYITDANKKHAIEQCACSGGAPNGQVINGWRAVGNNGQYDATGTIGTIHRTNAVTQTKCPSGWLSGSTNVDGGVTTDGRCKKLSGTLSITPVPANGTPLGTYGFSWGNEIWAWGTTANGGAPITTVVTPASCHF